MKISLRAQILCGLLLLGMTGLAALPSYALYETRWLPQEFAGIAVLAAFGLCFFAASVMFTRLLQWLAPIRAGRYAFHELGDVVVLHVFLDLFNRSLPTNMGIVPIPLRPLFYKALGAKIGRDTVVDGIIADVQFMTLGERVILGYGSILGAHCTEGGKTVIENVIIEDDVTIGVYAVVAPGVRIGKGAIIAAASVVAKGTIIPAGEVWGGVPARKLKDAPVKPLASREATAPVGLGAVEMEGSSRMQGRHMSPAHSVRLVR